MTTRECHACAKRGGYNCNVPGEDGQPVQCVGAWSKDKHAYLDKYLAATSGVRKKFFQYDNTVFVDLFSGPGKCVVEHTGEEINGGCLRAANRDDCGFNEYHFVDIDRTNIECLERRIEAKDASLNFYHADANEAIKGIVAGLAEHPKRYHVFYLDPFAPENLRFSTIECLSTLQRVDLFMHFPIGPIRRNLKAWKEKKDKNSETILDRFLGTDAWRDRVEDMLIKGNMFVLLEIFKEQLIKTGFPEEGLRYQNLDDITPLTATAIKNEQHVDLYLLMVAAKNPLAQEIWHSVLQIDAKGQKRLF